MSFSSLAWIILFAPLIAAILIFFGGKCHRRFSASIAIGSAALCCALSWCVFFVPGILDAGKFDWINIQNVQSTFHVPFALVLDPLSKLMIVLVSTIALLVFIYSVGYMANEEGYSRYFSGLSLFLFSMLGIVLSSNFVMMFIFWELVGLSSYILIGHYYERDAAAEACKQAFIVNRIGDFGFLIGILMIWVATGSVIFTDIFGKSHLLLPHTLWLNAGCILIFCGAVGKSAQLPLHVWLPNSMEGPTPVSSLLHAATMVAAGVYMLARVFPLLVLAPLAREVIAWVGVLTCLAAALMALQQDDIKRILAYSTISQLGYMMLGVGVAASFGVPIFHLFTHAFFKCLLFLAAGSVIVALHHEQNIWKMGGLCSRMPGTCLLMLIGGLALAGMPFFSGSFSKDLILAWAAAARPSLFWIGACTVGLTAFYTARLFLVTFLGQARSPASQHASESPAVMLIPMCLLAIPSICAGYPIVQKFFVPAVEEPHLEAGSLVPMWLFFLGLLVAALFYARNPAKDPLRIPLFAERFYIDTAYDWIVRKCQDGLAVAILWVDRWVINSVCVQGIARATWSAGSLLRYLQSGNVQAYACFFAFGVILFLFYFMFK